MILAPVLLPFATICAQRLADWIGAEAERVAIAGSIRRQRPQCSDVDMVVIPKTIEDKDLYGDVHSRRNITRLRLDERARVEKWQIRFDGEEIWSATYKGVQVDVFWASEANWGTRLLCRTGSKEHNIWLAQWAQARGCKWNPQAGLYELNHRVSATEEKIYTYLQLPCIDPVNREAAYLARHHALGKR